MDAFLGGWAEAATTTVGLFWMAFWAFALGYLVSSAIQVFVTRARMQQAMGKTGPRSVALGTVFGFVSSSCSFSALSTTRSLFSKGAGLIPSLAFLLASTNLVIELGITIAVFLSWQFVVGEYVGGILLIGLMIPVVALTLPASLEEDARDNAREAEGSVDDDTDEAPSMWERMTSREGWRDVAHHYVMEWGMVYKDVSIGFTVAGIVSAFVPASFFQALFIGAGSSDPAVWQLVAQTLVGPVAAFFTFIGSMGNIPLAAVLFGNGVSFAGVMAFIFSDLVVFPVLRIQASYYGWRMALYILGVFLVILVASALLLHLGFDLLGILPSAQDFSAMSERNFFKVDYTLFLNVGFAVVSVVLGGWHLATRMAKDGSATLGERVLLALAVLSWLWLAIGLGLRIFLEA